MKTTTVIAFIFLLAGCLGKKDTEQDDDNLTQPLSKGSFKIQLNGKLYMVDIKCIDFGTEAFSFNSDHNDVDDSNNDGLVIAGSQHGNALGITIMDYTQDGVVQFSTTPTTKIFTTKGNIIKGKAKFVKGLSNKNFIEDVAFEILCQ